MTGVAGHARTATYFVSKSGIFAVSIHCATPPQWESQHSRPLLRSRYLSEGLPGCQSVGAQRPRQHDGHNQAQGGIGHLNADTAGARATQQLSFQTISLERNTNLIQVYL